MMAIRSLWHLATVAALSASMPASAAVTVVTGALSGAQEIPPVTTSGTGFATVTIDDVLNTMRLQITFSGLTGNTTASHIHCCAAFGTSAGVATTTPTFAGFPLGVTSGSYDNTLDLTLASSYNPAFVTANGGTVASARTALITGIVAGRSYLNIHTSFAPGGEIRGQLLSAVPEAATWTMMVAGFGIMGVAMRRRRPVAAVA
jgi:CHRD domain/PEP-CTERM motif